MKNKQKKSQYSICLPDCFSPYVLSKNVSLPMKINLKIKVSHP